MLMEGKRDVLLVPVPCLYQVSRLFVRLFHRLRQRIVVLY